MNRGFIVILLTTFSLSLLSILFVASMQTGPINLVDPQIDVEATAHAIQLKNRQTEIEAASQERQLILQNQITQGRQDLADLNQTAQSRTTQLENQLSSLQVQIKQDLADIEAVQGKITQLQKTIQDDETGYLAEMTNLETDIEQTNNELVTTQSQLQAAYDELNKPQIPGPAVTTLVGSIQLSSGLGDDSGSRSNNNSNVDHNNSSDEGHDDDDHDD